jgi:hypothetical protein
MGLAVGRDERGRTVRIPVGHASGRHALVVGATGSGKTVTQAWIAGRLVQAGHGAVPSTPRATACCATKLEHAARNARRAMRLWTSEGRAVYNPFAHGTDTELADEVLAGETYLGAGAPTGEGTRTRTREFVVTPTPSSASRPVTQRSAAPATPSRASRG